LTVVRTTFDGQYCLEIDVKLYVQKLDTRFVNALIASPCTTMKSGKISAKRRDTNMPINK